jgi:hypothetical protein
MDVTSICLVVDFDLEKFTVENCKSYFEEKDVFFCALGTTRSAASQQPGNTAENFRRIDLHLVTRCAEIAKSAGVRHASLVSSQGAKTNSWFLYMKTKGEAEKSLEDLGFDQLAIWRPGLLGRGSEARFGEKVAKIFMKVMPVEDVAQAMRKEAEKWSFDGDELPKVSRYDNRSIWNFCQDSTPSKASQAASSPVSTQQEQGGQEQSGEGEKQAVEQGDEGQTNEQVPDVDKSQPDDEGKDKEEPKPEEASS